MKIIYAALLSIVTLAFMGCDKDESSTTLYVRMTDAPLAVQEVNVDLREIEVKMEKDTTKWYSLQTNAKVYNLLELQNGVDVLVAQGTFSNTENVKEIRLILGPNNSIKVDNITLPLTIPSGSESGLKIKIGKQLRSSFETILIDFDAALSIKQEVDGYKLKPVIKLK